MASRRLAGTGRSLFVVPLVVSWCLATGAPTLAGVTAEANRAAGSAFLAENKSSPGVVTTDSGLQYLVLVAGTGPRPRKTETVTVHYRGTLVDGTEFDSSHRLGEPVSFHLDGVIPGWAEALQLMPVGSTYRLFVPPELAYGEKGAGLMIGPQATLLFDVELLASEP